MGRQAVYKGYETSPERQARQEAILSILHDDGPQSQKSLAGLLDQTEHYVRRAIEPLLDEGKVGVFKRGRVCYFILGQDIFGEEQ